LRTEAALCDCLSLVRGKLLWAPGPRVVETEAPLPSRNTSHAQPFLWRGTRRCVSPRKARRSRRSKGHPAMTDLSIRETKGSTSHVRGRSSLTSEAPYRGSGADPLAIRQRWDESHAATMQGTCTTSLVPAESTRVSGVEVMRANEDLGAATAWPKDSLTP
jgi:hypothetical protein